MMEMILYLIRHAQSHPTSTRHYSEWPLSSTGKEQAAKLPGLLEPLGIQKLFSSPFARCLQTVEPFVEKLGISMVVDEDLRERLVAKTMVDGFYEIWCRSWEDFNFALQGCESSAHAQRRFVAAVTRIADSSWDETIGISTHGNVIGLFLNSIDTTAGRHEAEQLMTPDVLRVVRQNRVFNWDRDFRLPGIEPIATRPEW